MKINLDPMPARTSEEIHNLVEKQIEKMEASIITGLRSFLIQPRLESRDWGWSQPIQTFPVWIIAESQQYDYCLLYSDYGFGPVNPWGLGFSSYKGFDADYCWYGSLEAAYRDSRLIEEYDEKKLK
ncbi:MAG: hypothetical protein LV480_04925 [Methylacidiphilales bacterium]|nr:hypothetical protein [Candidatus Methylacidiphilales bacterium]